MATWNKIATATGTSSQFIKGDGSLDSTTYSTGSHSTEYSSGGAITGTLNITGSTGVTVLWATDTSKKTAFAYDGIYTQGAQHQYISSAQNIQFYPSGVHKVTFNADGSSDFDGDVTVSRLKVNDKFVLEDVSDVLWVGEYIGTIRNKKDTIFDGVVAIGHTGTSGPALGVVGNIGVSGSVRIGSNSATSSGVGSSQILEGSAEGDLRFYQWNGSAWKDHFYVTAVGGTTKLLQNDNVNDSNYLELHDVDGKAWALRKFNDNATGNTTDQSDMGLQWADGNVCLRWTNDATHTTTFGIQGGGSANQTIQFSSQLTGDLDIEYWGDNSQSRGGISINANAEQVHYTGDDTMIQWLYVYPAGQVTFDKEVTLQENLYLGTNSGGNKWINFSTTTGDSGITWFETGTYSVPDHTYGAKMYYDASMDRLYIDTRQNGVTKHHLGFRRSTISTEVYGNLQFAGTYGMVFYDTAHQTSSSANNAGDYVKITAPTSIGTSYTIKWPNNAGSANNVMKVDGSGNLSWTPHQWAEGINDCIEWEDGDGHLHNVEIEDGLIVSWTEQT